MKLTFTIVSCIFFIVIGVGILSFTKHKPTPLKFVVPKGWPQPVYDFKTNPITKEGFELGKRLFYDNILSIDNSISCASCHQQFGAFSTYDHNLSHGINFKLTTRNAPALQNLAWQKDFMADGGVNHLDLQPLVPILSDIEMGETLEGLINKLKKDSAYPKQFKAAFGDELINTQRLCKAISQYVLMLVSSNSKYDRVMQEKDTFNLPEKLGYQIFQNKCVSCHKEPMFTDYTFRNAGLTMNQYLKDEGRMAVTLDKKDSLKFRVPTLRNVAITAPYGHDGRFFSLSSVFNHYRNSMVVGPTTDSLLRNKIPLSNFEIGQLTAFLSTLTDTSFLRNKMYAPEGYNITPTFIHNH